ncbi:MAG: hypothetical protein K8I30_07560, partial [Anaerolineae bacterium]|nr:hypothetical protein [Anaerolineae bacterium]
MADATPGAAGELARIWQSLADDPQQQALTCADWCLHNAPHLAVGLKHQILNNLPDALLTHLVFQNSADGRIQALNRLSEYEYNHVPPPPPPPVPKPRLQAANRAARKPDVTAEAIYEQLFGVMPVVDYAAEPVRVDWELGRLAIKTHTAEAFRLWAIARDLTIREGGSGAIFKKQLRKRLNTLHVSYSPRHFNRLLQDGLNVFWRLDAGSDKLYLISYAKVSERLLIEAGEAEAPTNLPGVRPVYLDPSGGVQRWESMLYAGWIAGRGYKEAVTISRDTLADLFGR